MEYGKNMTLEIAKQIGQPISKNLPVPVELSVMANLETAGVGEKVWRYSAVDDTADIVYQINSDGTLDEVKRDPVGDAQLSFQGLNSKKEHVLIDDILGASDNTGVLARRKASIIRAMDKKEVYSVIQGILGNTALGQANSNFVPGVSCQSVSPSSGQDLYDVIMDMKHKVEDYGDDYLLLCGSTVKEKIDTYGKDNASSFNYDVGLNEMLNRNGIKVMKVFGTFKDGAGSSYRVMDKKKMILISRNSRIAEGKPLTFVRRRIDPEMAKVMGADINEAYRAVFSESATIVTGGENTFGYSVWGYESVIFLITNPYAICAADATVVL